MKKFSLTLLLVVICLLGCKKKDKTEEISSFSPNYYKADSLFRAKNDSAFYYYNLAAINSTNSLEKAVAYNRMGAILFTIGDHSGLQDVVTKSLKLLNDKDQNYYSYILSNYNLLGQSNYELKNYDEAMRYFEMADNFLKKDEQNLTLLNNKASVLQKMGQYEKAIAIYQSILDKNKKDTIIYARALSNLARTKWLENPAYNAAPELLTALKLREIKNFKPGLTTSYSHLSDYYANKHPDSSLFFAREMYKVAQNADDRLDALVKMSKYEPLENIRNLFNIFDVLNDSIEQIRKNNKNQFAAIRFEAEQSKAENLELRQTNIKQRVILYSSILGFIILTGMAITWYRRRRKKMQLEAQQAIQESQLKTSKKVHDVVANGLYRIMTNLEHTDTLSKEPLLDEIENLYEQSRDISYEQPMQQAGEYSTRIHRLLSSFGTANTKILIAGNQEATWSKLSAHEKKEIELVLQELMINMSKHSQAKNVVIKFSNEPDHFAILYKDNGVGFLPSAIFGNGLRNTETRIKNLGGTIIFDGTNGLRIEISLPIEKAND